jgi:hypothetical protein
LTLVPADGKTAAGALRHVGPDRVLRRSQNADPAAAVLDDGQAHLGAVEQVGGEEARRQDRLCLRSQEPGPARAIAAGRRADAGVFEDLPAVDGATVMPGTASSPWTRR